MSGGKKSHIYKANKNRLVESDFNRKIQVQSYIGSGYNSEQYQTLKTPHGRYQQRKPDILIKICGYYVPVELDGGCHGYNDEITETEQTKTRNDDYTKSGYLPIILNHEQLSELGISEETYIKCAIISFEPILRSKRRLSLERKPRRRWVNQK
jgi:hypothetical protein